MKYNIFFTLQDSTGETVEAQSPYNPVEYEDIRACVKDLHGMMSKSSKVECIAVRIKREESCYTQ